MLLAAGRGERMRELTRDRPKPMLEVGGRPLLEHALDRILTAGYRDITINVAWKADVLLAWLDTWRARHLPTRGQSAATVRVSREPDGALETAGGIVHALYRDGATLRTPKGRRDVILAVNADVLCDASLAPPVLDDGDLGHLLLVPNPEHHPAGDFRISCGRVRTRNAGESASPDTFTFSGIGWYRGELFAGLAPGRAALGPLLHRAARDGRLSGTVHHGLWLDVGTPERLAEANARVCGSTANTQPLGDHALPTHQGLT